MRACRCCKLVNCFWVCVSECFYKTPALTCANALNQTQSIPGLTYSISDESCMWCGTAFEAYPIMSTPRFHAAVCLYVYVTLNPKPCVRAATPEPISYNIAPVSGTIGSSISAVSQVSIPLVAVRWQSSIGDIADCDCLVLSREWGNGLWRLL